MDATTFTALLLACAPQVHPQTARALVQVESAFNPWAIGVVGGSLQRQPRNKAEAMATAQVLRTEGWNFSVGLGQINLHNFGRLGLSLDSAFDPCTNLRAMQVVLADCYQRAGRNRLASDTAPPADAASTATPSGDAAKQATGSRQKSALQRALSCYYSGNFRTGFLHGYVQKVLAAVLAAPHAAAPTAVSSTANPKEST